MFKKQVRDIQSKDVFWDAELECCENKVVKHGKINLGRWKYIKVLCPDTFLNYYVYKEVAVYRGFSGDSLEPTPTIVNLKRTKKSSIWKIKSLEEEL